MALLGRVRPLVTEVDLIDRAVYTAVAGTPSPSLDGAMRRISHAANYSRISMTAAIVMSAAGGPRGRRAAVSGLASLAATSAFVNLIVKPVGRRRRPERSHASVPRERHVPMPATPSFPSGHTAAAVAFAGGAGRVLPAASVPLHALAAIVGYSRIHTGVHYPGDVVAGAMLGAVIDDLTAGAINRTSTRSRSRGSSPP